LENTSKDSFSFSSEFEVNDKNSAGF
jgi:hypothetical protein